MQALARRGELSGTKRNRIRFQTRLSLMTWKYKSDPHSPFPPLPAFSFFFSERRKPRSSQDRYYRERNGGRRGKVSEFLATASKPKCVEVFFDVRFRRPDFPPAFGFTRGISPRTLSLTLSATPDLNRQINEQTDRPTSFERRSRAHSRSFRPPRRPSSSTLVYIFRIVSFSFLCRKLRRGRGKKGMEWNGGA